MRAYLCRLLLYLPSAVLYLKLQLQNLCNFSQTPPFKAFHWEYLHVNAAFFLPALPFALPVYVFLNRACNYRVWDIFFLFMLHYVLLIARCGREERRRVFWLRGGQVIVVSDRRTRRGRERRKEAAMAYCERTKSYFHQFTEVEINMTVAYLFQWLYFWVISRQMTRWGLV